MIRAIALDMDDTLLDTTGLLLPAAALRACEAMHERGLVCPMQNCLDWRAEFSTKYSHREIFTKIAERAGNANFVELGEVGMLSFYNSPIPPELPLLAGADEALDFLSSRYALYLVTSGSPDTQWDKVRALGLEPRFRKIYVIDKLQKQNKQTAFRDILARERIQPSELLSVGNRLAEEIRLAKQLGASTCYFRYGEHVGEKIEVTEDNPDFTIDGWKDFLTTCQL